MNYFKIKNKENETLKNMKSFICLPACNFTIGLTDTRDPTNMQCVVNLVKY